MESYRFMGILNDVNEAVGVLEKYLSRMIAVEKIYVDEKLVGRYSARDVVATGNIPPVNRAVVDGCAAMSIDIGGASPEAPVILKKKAIVYAGDKGGFKLDRGECVEVATGAVVPENSDVVIPAEYIVDIGGSKVSVIKEFNTGYGVSLKGEDLKQGELIVRKGDRLLEHHIAMMSALGISEAEVWRLPRIALFSTGDEVVEPGTAKSDGQVFDSTRRLVKGFLTRIGFTDILDYGIVPDNADIIRKTLFESLSKADLVVTIGGTSVGKRDTTIRTVEELDSKVMIHGFALTPGRPAGLTVTSDEKIILSLSGMPVAALTELLAILEPALAKSLGRSSRILPVIKGVLKRRLVTHPGMLNYVRSRLTCGDDGRIYVEPLRLTGSGILSTLKEGPGIVVVPPHITGFNEGDIVDVILYDYQALNCKGGVS
ncbi:MAG: molybdopterin molybdotransferase MoeA [Desulfurococcales archaeon]|nr:molybdopterin molybdotransferase MoeA [Desulfurococcales archaeon]